MVSCTSILHTQCLHSLSQARSAHSLLTHTAHVRLATHDTGYISACKILPSLHGPIPRKFSRDQRIDAVEAHKELVMLKGLAGANIPSIVGLEGVISCQGWK